MNMEDGLAGKRILFVDDKRVTVQFYIEELERQKATVHHVESLSEAYTKISSADPQYDGIVIDLYLPPLPVELHKYTGPFGKLHMNQGQALGIFLMREHPQIRYCYCSVAPDLYKPVAGEFGLDGNVLPPAPYLIDKGQVSPAEVVSMLGRLLASEWKTGSKK